MIIQISLSCIASNRGFGIVSFIDDSNFCSNINYADRIRRSKRAATLKARDLDMARAVEILSGPTLTVEDDRRDYGEKRCITVEFLDGTMVVLIWTSRGNAYRIISLRKANERER